MKLIEVSWVALGGAIGSVARYATAELVHRFFEHGFPWGTLTVNVLGSFLMGFLAIYLFYQLDFANQCRAFFLVGLLGAYTTFSTFSLDTFSMFMAKHYFFAVGNIFLSVVLCLLSTGLGVWLAYNL